MKEKFDRKEEKASSRKDSREDSRSRKKRGKISSKREFKEDKKSSPYVDQTPRDPESYTSGHNDIKWLLHNPALAQVATRVPFGHPLGYGLDLFDAESSLSVQTEDYIIPGIIRIDSYLTAGRAKDVRSPVNQCALNSWVFLRHQGTGSLVDDPNDVAFYFLGIAQLLAYVGWIRRVFSELTGVNAENLYIRKGLIYAEGLDYDDLVSHMSDLAFFITWFASQVNNFIFPKMNYFDQAYTAFHHVYTDESLAKAQYYIFAPRQFGLMDYTSAEEGTMMTYGAYDVDGGGWVTLEGFGAGRNASYAQLVGTGRAMLDVMINDQAVATLGAAILKAYGAENLWRLADLDVLHMELEISMDMELAMQIHNIQLAKGLDLLYPQSSFNSKLSAALSYYSVIPPVGTGVSPYMINDGDFTYTPAGSGTIATGDGKFVKMYYDLFTDVPSEGEVLLASRLKSICTLSIENTGRDLHVWLESFDAVLPVAIVKIIADGSTFISQHVPQYLRAIGVNTLRIYPCEFNFAPIVFNFGDSDNQQQLVGDIQNFTVVNNDVVSNIQLSNLLSLFEVPKYQ